MAGRGAGTGVRMTTYQLEIDREQARNGVGGLSVALGAAAVLAPTKTARLLGVKGADSGAGPLFVRMIGVRNAVMGLRTLQATGDDQAKALQAGLAVGAVDAVAVLLAARKGRVTKKAALGMLLLLGAIATAGAVAAQQD